MSAYLPFYFFSFLLAFCSLFYEYVYAQILSVCLGGTKNQYLLIISLFTSALGLGSLLQGQFKKRFELKTMFLVVEILLVFLGSLGPFVIARILLPGNYMEVRIGLSYFLVFVIGLLSGFEMPCLFALAPKRPGKILAFDYLGMLFACVLFPLVFLPYWGSSAGTLIVASLNLVAVVWLLPESVSTLVKKVCYGLIVVLVLLVISQKDFLNHTLTVFYLGES